MPRCGSILLLLAALVIGGLTYTAEAAQPKRVLLLHSFGENFAPYSAFSASFRADLMRLMPEQVDFYDVSLLSARFPSKERDAPLVDYLLSLFADHRLDLIVAIGGPAVRFASDYRADLFPEVPMIISAVDERRMAGVSLSPNDTVVSVRLSFSKALAGIRELLPETKTVAVVFGSSELEKKWVSDVRQEFSAYSGEVRFEWLDHLTYDQMKGRAASLPRGSAILFAMLSVDAAGFPQIEARALREITATANAPSFGLFDFQMGDGIVGGQLVSSEQLAQTAAGVAVRVLNGEAPANIKTPVLEAGAPVFDGRQLQRWGIDEGRLPAGNTIRFGTLTPWDEYRDQLLVVGAVVLLQAALIAALLFERNSRRRAQLEARSRLVEVAHLNRAATTGAMSAAIAHELNQPLGAILANTEAAEQLLTRSPPDIAETKEALIAIRECEQRASGIIKRLRDLMRKRDIRREPVELGPVIQTVAQILSAEAKNRHIELLADQIPNRLFVLGDIVSLEQILLNLGLNAMDAMADTPESQRFLEFQAKAKGFSKVEISVLDTGTGIDPQMQKTIFDPFFTTKPQGTGLGLSVVRTLVEAMGGEIRAETMSSGGAAFRLIFSTA